MVFISASNELGAFESGAVAALVGTVTSVVAGGIATIGLALSWTRLFPSLARLGRLEDIRPEPVATLVATMSVDRSTIWPYVDGQVGSSSRTRGTATRPVPRQSA